jgi:hypothetical protein
MSDILMPTEITNESVDNNDNQSNAPEPISFWGEDPNVLFSPKFLTEFFPTENMTYEQKLNSVTRTVIILSLINVFIFKSIRHLIIGVITISSIYILHYYHEKEKKKVVSKKVVHDIKEGFGNPAMDYLTQSGEEIPTNVFSEPEPNNPFGNVLMSDYDYNPNKKPAPAAFNKNVGNAILKNAKELVIEANPDQPDIADKLFKDLGDQYTFEQSLRPFNSNPSTTIPNDQQAFSEFCYGSMTSCKEGNNFACARNMSRYTNY